MHPTDQTKAASVLDWDGKDPFPFYETLRAQGSPVWDAKANAWLVLDFQQCVEAEASEDVFGNIYANADPILAQIKGGTANITFSQGEEHARLRRFHLALLAARPVESYRLNHVRPVMDFVFNRLVPRGKGDLVKDMAAQIVPRVICSLMGMPWEDDRAIARILELNDCILRFVGANYRGDELRQQALDASAELNAMLRPHVRARRENPGDDFISRVWQEAPSEYGDDLTEDDAIAICRELYFAASDTTIHGTANALYLLLSDGAIRTQVVADRDRALKSLVEEGLRLYNVVQLRHRIAKQDTEMGGKHIRKGDMVLMVHAAANRDPGHYGCPAQADLGRKLAADHLAFGRGPRSCVGAQLARVEMREIVNAVLDRLPNVRLDPEAAPPHFAGFYIRSHQPLNVRWDECAPS